MATHTVCGDEFTVLASGLFSNNKKLIWKILQYQEENFKSFIIAIPAGLGNSEALAALTLVSNNKVYFKSTTDNFWYAFVENSSLDRILDVIGKF